MKPCGKRSFLIAISLYVAFNVLLSTLWLLTLEYNGITHKWLMVIGYIPLFSFWPLAQLYMRVHAGCMMGYHGMHAGNEKEAYLMLHRIGIGA